MHTHDPASSKVGYNAMPVCMILDTKHTVISRSFRNIKPDHDSIALINQYAKEKSGAIAQQVYLAFDMEMCDLNLNEENVSNLHEKAECYHISYRQSGKLFGEELSRESAKKEISDIIDKGCWQPIQYSTKKPDATSFMFMKDKRDKVNGELIKLKCRHVFSKIHGTDE